MKRKIEELTDMLSGQIILRVEAKVSKGDAIVEHRKAILPKSIDNGYINHNHLIEIDMKTKADKNKLTKEGDILIKMSTPYSAAMITKEDEDILATSFCIILRNIKGIMPEYLLAYFNSPTFKNKLDICLSGSTLAMLSISKLKDYTISVPEESKQKEIIKQFARFIKMEKLCSRIIDLEEKKFGIAISQLEE